MRFFVTAAKGTEPALRDELRELRLRGVRADRGGVHFEGEWADGFRACFETRVGVRVMTPLSSFACPSADALYQGVLAVDWSPYLSPRHTLSISASCRSSALTHSQFIAQRTKDAIVDQLRDRQGSRPSVDRDDPDVSVFVHLVKDEATVYLDLAGEPLHRRGYRTQPGPAPLKETLAAAVVRLSGWDVRSPLIDPMCGSGTIVVEAAMMAAQIAPGSLRRSFGFERWACHDQAARAAMRRIRDEAASRRPSFMPVIVGSDIDPAAVELARSCVARAGVTVRIEKRALSELRPLAVPGYIVTNPPYGHRLAEDESMARELAAVSRGMHGSRLAVISPSPAVPRAFPFRPDRAFILYNGDIECRLLCYSIRLQPQATMTRKRVLLPLPDRDFDVTEVAVPWRLLSAAGHEVVFATERGGAAPEADPLLLTGVLFGQLGADPEPRSFYRELERDQGFRRPIAWAEIDPGSFDALMLPGGHAPGMRQYLEGAELRRKIVAFWGTGKPVGAICHGVVALARAVDPGTGKSVLADRRTTCLPAYMERTAYYLTAWRLGRYYRTYPAYVEAEVRASLDRPEAQFVRGPLSLVTRGTATDDRAAFVVDDGRYVSARWPGDAYLFARRLLEKIG